MKNINSLLIIVVRHMLLIILSVLWIVNPQAKIEAQEAILPIYDGNAYITNVSWNLDSTTLTFQEDTGELGVINLLQESWYTYDLEQRSLTTANFWPQSYVSSSELRASTPPRLNLAVDSQAQISFSFLSPNQQYVVYAAQKPEGWELFGWPLALTNLQTGETVVASNTSVYNLAHFDYAYRVNWSADSSAFTVKTTSPYAADYVYYATGFNEQIQDISLTRLQELTVGEDTLFVGDTFADLSSDGRQVLLTGNLGGDVQPRDWLFIWDANDPLQGQLIDSANGYDFIDATFIFDQHSILYIGEDGLIKYEIETGESVILNSEINSTWVERAWFSPDARYVAFLAESSGELYIAEVPHS